MCYSEDVQRELENERKSLTGEKREGKIELKLMTEEQTGSSEM